MKNIKQKFISKLKYLNFLIKKTLLKHQNKTNNIFVNKFKFKVSNLNKYLFKVSNLNKYLFNVSNFNKYLIVLIALLFVYLFYLSIPTLYNKGWVQNTIENKLVNEFKLRFSISSEISYEILPSPHFTIKNAKIFDDNIDSPRQFSEIKKLKIFISQKNLFNKDKLFIKKILIDRANFSFQERDFNFFNKFISNQFSSKKIIIKNSNIFFKDKINETISIIKIPKFYLFYDELKLLNKINFNGEIFKIPFNFTLNKQIFSSPEITKTKINFKKINIKFFNESMNTSGNEFGNINGINILSIFNSRLVTSYEIKDETFIFKSNDSTFKNSIEYNGKLNFDPFHFILDINLDGIGLKRLLDSNSLFVDLLKTKLLFNENITSNISLTSNNLGNKLVNSADLNINIKNGVINFDNSKLVSNKIGFLQVTESNLFFRDKALILNSDFNIKVKNTAKLFSYFQTPKKLRIPINSFLFNVDFNFFNGEITLNSLRINNQKPNQKIEFVIDEFNEVKGIDFENLIKNRNLFNQLLEVYSG